MRTVFLHAILLHQLGSALLHMEVLPGVTRCIGQELDEEDYALFSMSAVHAGKHPGHSRQNLVATVLDPFGVQLLSEKIKIGGISREETLNISERGVYNLCFDLADGETPARVSFDIMFKDREVDEIKTIKKGNIPSLEYQLRLAEEAMVTTAYVFSIKDDIIIVCTAYVARDNV